MVYRVPSLRVQDQAAPSGQLLGQPNDDSIAWQMASHSGRPCQSGEPGVHKIAVARYEARTEVVTDLSWTPMQSQCAQG